MSVVFTKHLFTITENIAKPAATWFGDYPALRADYVTKLTLNCLSTVVLLNAKHGAKDAEAMDITFTNVPTKVHMTLRWVIEDGIDKDEFAGKISYYLATYPKMLSPNVVAIERAI